MRLQTKVLKWPLPVDPMPENQVPSIS